MTGRFIVAAAVLAGLAGVASAQTTIQAHPTANNGGSSGWAIFMDFTSLAGNLIVTHMQTATSAAAGATFNVETFVRTGTALGGPVGVGPGSSPAGWTSLGVVQGTQGALSSGISQQIDIPDIAIPAGQTVGVAFMVTVAGPRYFGTGTPPYSVFTDGILQLTTGDARSAPFTPTGSFFTSRALAGSVTYIPAPSAMALLGAAGLLAARRRR